MNVELLWYTPFPEYRIAEAALATRKKDPSVFGFPRQKFIQHLIKQGHDSVLEFASAAFRIEGVSRVLLSQLTRHRLASFAVESHRHTMARREYTIPESIKKVGLTEEFKDLMNKCFDFYTKAFSAGVPKEDARYILPQAVHTSLVVCANFREWRYILKLRLDKSSQWEIRNLCEDILRILVNISPAVFGDIADEYGIKYHRSDIQLEGDKGNWEVDNESVSDE